MLALLRRFLADDDGYLVAQDWVMVATVLTLGSALALVALQRSLAEPPRPEVRPTIQKAAETKPVGAAQVRP